MSMDEKETRDDEEGRPEDEEAEVKISPSYICVNPFYLLAVAHLILNLCYPFCLFVGKLS